MKLLIIQPNQSYRKNRIAAVLTAERRHLFIQEFVAGNLMAGVRSLGLAEDNVGYLLTDGNRHLISDAILEKLKAFKESIFPVEITVPMVRATANQGA
ncbi:hypothetical protein F4167_02695, partial [Candidatus Poribacteria bacterium]|nr:hypothetical protein [Candidatus Poribacteria bacterium]